MQPSYNGLKHAMNQIDSEIAQQVCLETLLEIAASLLSDKPHDHGKLSRDLSAIDETLYLYNAEYKPGPRALHIACLRHLGKHLSPLKRSRGVEGLAQVRADATKIGRQSPLTAAVPTSPQRATHSPEPSAYLSRRAPQLRAGRPPYHP